MSSAISFESASWCLRSKIANIAFKSELANARILNFLPRTYSVHRWLLNENTSILHYTALDRGVPQAHRSFLLDAGSPLPYDIVWDGEVYRYGNGFSTLDFLQGKLNRTEEAIHVVKDTVLLSKSALFLGVFKSNLSRVIAELGAALHSFQVPP